MTAVEFVQKLLNILENCPQTVQWINNGKQFEIVNVDEFTRKILPQYFRHGKFQSFIRQLNMYGFHKVNRRKNSYIFQHEHFVENKEADYNLIKRSKKNKAQSKTKYNKSAEIQIDSILLSQKAPKMAELLNKLIQYNTKNQFDFRKLKSKLDLLSRQVSAKKQRNLRPIIKNIRQKILLLDQIQKSMGNINWQIFNNCNQQSPTKSSSANSENNDMFDGRRQIFSAPVFGQKKQQENGHEQVSLNNLCSFKSISSFIAFS